MIKSAAFLNSRSAASLSVAKIAAKLFRFFVDLLLATTRDVEFGGPSVYVPSGVRPSMWSIGTFSWGRAEGETGIGQRRNRNISPLPDYQLKFFFQFLLAPNYIRPKFNNNFE